MEELGIIVDQNGNYMSFGKWVTVKLRDDKDPSVKHDSAFTQQVYKTEWFQSLQVPYIVSENVHFHNQLDVFAKAGILIIVNNTNDDIPSFAIASPSSITDAQIQFLLNKKNEFISFEDNNISFIDVFDVNDDYNILNEFYHITDYYDYIDKLIEDRKQQTK